MGAQLFFEAHYVLQEFPALEGQSVSFAVLKYSAGSVNPPPHTPPRIRAPVRYYGSLEVGLVDTSNKLFTQTLQTGDMFIHPKGLVHYQYNANQTNFAIALSEHGSASAGTVSVPLCVFATNINNGILAKSFKTNSPSALTIHSTSVFSLHLLKIEMEPVENCGGG
ncbi:hypothetical protein NL676_025780 [Syzygium grande]|nr:hypothetical protein NL676_025780 [Syzygium grande]